MAVTPKRHLRSGQSYWLAQTPASIKTSQKPKRDFYDCVIIGCGVTGAMAAEALSGHNLNILMVDRRLPAGGSTTASTALIQWEIDTPLKELARKIGPAKAKGCYRASLSAVGSLKRKIRRLGIACDLASRNTLLLAGQTMGAVALQREAAARKRAGLPSTFIKGDELAHGYGLSRDGAILSTGSLELDPRKLALGLAKVVKRRGVEIVAPLTVSNIYCSDAGVLLKFDSGAVIAARKVIAATGYEALPEIPKSKYSIISTWALATVKQPKTAFWGNRELVWEASDPYLYFRTTKDGRIIVGGEDADYYDPVRRDRQTQKKTRRILQKIGRLLPGADLRAEFTWAGSFAESPTGLPVIGPVSGLPNLFAILGAGGNGITYSAIAAELAEAWATGKPHPLEKLFAAKI